VDLVWLGAVLNWGMTWEERGRRLLRENAVRGFELLVEKNPRRPFATDDRYEATRAVSDQVLMEIRRDGHRRVQRSYLSELLDLANGTAQRISAICQLRYEDLRLASTTSAPHGAIRWPGETDKEGREWWAPISATVRTALDISCTFGSTCRSPTSPRPAAGGAPRRSFAATSSPTRALCFASFREVESCGSGRRKQCKTGPFLHRMLAHPHFQTVRAE